MAANIRYCIILLYLVPGINTEGQFTVLHSPSSIKFEGEVPLQETSLKEIYCAALGLSVDMTNVWTEIKIENPFETPEAAVEIYVEGVSSIGPFENIVIAYSLSDFAAVSQTYDFLVNRLIQQNKLKSKLIHITLSREYDMKMYSNIFGQLENLNSTKIPLICLNYNDEHDYQFIREIQALKLIIDTMKSGAIKPDGIVDFYSFKFTSLHALSTAHGLDSLKFGEAKTLLSQYIGELKEAFVSLYDGSVMFTVVSDGSQHTRHRRDLPLELPASFDDDLVFQYLFLNDKPVLREAPPDTDGPAVFNIIFFTCLSLYFALIAVVYVLVTLDPGRDSIVYRMTSSIDRIKME